MLSLWIRCLHLNYLYESVETPHSNFVVRSSADPIQVVANVSHDSCRCGEPSGSCLLGPVSSVPLRRHAWKGLPVISMRDSPLTGVALHQRGLDYLSCYWFNKTWYCHISKFFLPELWNITYKGLGYTFLIASVKNRFLCTYQTGFFFSSC